MQLFLKTLHPVSAPPRASDPPRPTKPLLRHSGTVPDKEKAGAPDVTNQTDKEPGRPWTAAQLWLQLRTVVEPGWGGATSEKEEEKRTEIIDWDQSTDIATSSPSVSLHF